MFFFCLTQKTEVLGLIHNENVFIITFSPEIYIFQWYHNRKLLFLTKTSLCHFKSNAPNEQLQTSHIVNGFKHCLMNLTACEHLYILLFTKISA